MIVVWEDDLLANEGTAIGRWDGIVEALRIPILLARRIPETRVEQVDTLNLLHSLVDP